MPADMTIYGALRTPRVITGRKFPANDDDDEAVYARARGNSTIRVRGSLKVEIKCGVDEVWGGVCRRVWL